ncbi:hypothetical protein [Planococcus glaciei]|uniref:hypothetical protein n=1 Tax=Planococcus glaciei TaxID=459472 RepID=UPI000941E6BC|nr:hypothetical protein [Planococcus glaciei]
MEVPLIIEQMAKRANVSVFHFQRSLAILTDMAVGEYLQGRQPAKWAAPSIILTGCQSALKRKLLIHYRKNNEVDKISITPFKKQAVLWGLFYSSQSFY